MSFTRFHQQLLQFFENHHLLEKQFLLAYSGGLDSTVLLHMLSCCIDKSQIDVIHIDHQLQPQSSEWANHCSERVKALGVTCTVVKVDIHSNGEGVEQAARKARYHAIDSVLSDRVLLTAHHQDDQVETVLLQLARGAGIEGLSGMKDLQSRGDGLHIRPLLAVSRAELQQYADEVGISWVDDPSNQDESFDRNYLRHRIIPLLKERWPSFGDAVSRSSAHFQNQHAWNQAYWDARLGQSIDTNQLDASLLHGASHFEKQHIFRAWFKRQGVRYPNKDRLDTLINTVPNGTDQGWKVAWRSYTHRVSIRYYRDIFYLVNEDLLSTAFESFEWQPNQVKVIDELSVSLDSQLLETFPIDPTLPCLVCFRSLNMQHKLMLKGHVHRKKIKNYFQENGVPPWYRSLCPQVFQEGQLVALLIPNFNDL